MSDIVWTNHLQERLLQRGISKNEAFDTIRHPDKTVKGKSSELKFFKYYDYKHITVVADKRNGQWIIITAWSKKPGEKNTYWSGKKDPLPTRVGMFLLRGFVKFLKNLFAKS